MNAKQLLEEEKALEEQLFGTPSDDPSKSEEATTVETEDNSVPTQAGETDKSTAEPTEPEVKPEEDWEKRYKGLRASREQKLYDTQSALAERESQVLELQERINKLESQVAKPKEVSIGDVLSEEERDSLGDTAISAIDKAAKAVADSKVESLEKELADIREKANVAAKDKAKAEADNAYGIFLKRLGHAVPDFKDLNTNEDFIEYLQELDLDGATRFDNLRIAEQRGDVAGVARHMLDFKSKRDTKEDKLEELVTPKQTASPPKEPKEEAGYLTMAQVDAHYKKHERGGYKGREKEFLKMEQMIDEYAATGRIKR